MESFIFDDVWRSWSRINGIRSWLSECNGAYSPVSFHHDDDNRRKWSISLESTELCVDSWREDDGINLKKNHRRNEWYKNLKGILTWIDE